MANVGKKTGKQTQAGRDVYETPEGEMVSEKSTTIEYKGKWINVPTIHGGKQYSEDQLVEMLDEGLIEPTSVHDELKEAISAAEERSKSLEFNKGGTTMKDQMSMFEEGGLEEEGGMVDEESGNDVPTGSSREEVRDDIPAMLSEGEFVFPADVVRYHGLEKLMELRQEAKMGMKKMEAMGQMGNADEATLPDDIPFTMDDLIIVAEPMEPKEKAHGGMIHAAEGTFVPSTEQQQLSTGVMGQQPSIYANPVTPLPIVQPTPPSSVVPVPPVAAPTAGFSPLYQAEPTPQVAPTFETPASEFVDDVSDAYKKVKYINPATGETMMIDEHLGNPVQAVPAGYIKYDDYIAGGGAPSTDTGATTVASTQTIRQPSDSGDKDRIRQLKEAGDRERQQANYKAKQEKLATGSADDLLDMWLDNKRVLGAGQSMFGLSPIIGGLTSAAGLKEQSDIEKVLDDRFAGWREGKGLSKEHAQKLKDYKEGGFFRNSKAFGNALFNDVKEAVMGLDSVFSAEGRSKFYKEYANKGPKYNVSSNNLSRGATGFVATGKTNKSGMPQSSGNLSIKEQQAYDNAISSGNSSTADHYAIIAAHRQRQDTYADAMKKYEKTKDPADLAAAQALGATMSAGSRDQAIRFGGSVHRAVENGTATKDEGTGTRIFAKYKTDAMRKEEAAAKEKDGDKDTGGLFGDYSCYVATALNDKGYWPTIKKMKLIKWCMDSKPENKFDTKLWRNGYTVFGKTIIAPHVDNKIIQWLSDGFYDSRVKNKKSLKSLIGLLFFYVPSYTIALYKMLRNDLVDIERT